VLIPNEKTIIPYGKSILQEIEWDFRLGVVGCGFLSSHRDVRY
jgi:hypothetical protein